MEYASLLTSDRMIADCKSTIEKNFGKYSRYINCKYKTLHELQGLMYQATKCVMLEMNEAAICTTNHLLERLLKLALITNDVGIKAIPVEQWSAINKEPTKKYQSLELGKTINLCKQKGLINKVEAKHIQDTIRQTMRNGYNHADYSKIIPAEGLGKFRVWKGNFFTPDKPLEEVTIEVDHTIFESLYLENFAKQKAPDYLFFVFELMSRIIDRLIEKNNA